jgi:hypothetical protein
MHRCLLRALLRFNKIKAEKKRKEAERKQRETELRKQMANLRIIQKTLVYVIGLSPRMADEEVCDAPIPPVRLACLAAPSSPPLPSPTRPANNPGLVTHRIVCCSATLSFRAA